MMHTHRQYKSYTNHINKAGLSSIMIILLGTSHVSTQSSKEVQEAMSQVDIVALELDAGRAQGLLEDRKATFKELKAALGLKAALMATVLRSIQEKAAKNIGVLPGVEMRMALKEAAKQRKQIFLIDREIRITIKRLSDNFGWREIKQISKDMFRRRAIPVHPSDDLVVELLEEMKMHYPRIYKVMVAERDHHMAVAAVKLQAENPEKNILVVVGKGHVKGMTHQINYLNSQMQVSVWHSPETSSKQ
jgi:pheromone shutdown protein TraB